MMVIPAEIINEVRLQNIQAVLPALREFRDDYRADGDLAGARRMQHIIDKHFAFAVRVLMMNNGYSVAWVVQNTAANYYKVRKALKDYPDQLPYGWNPPGQRNQVGDRAEVGDRG